MKQYDVKGMTCAACVSRVEKAVSSVSGVESCSVSLLTNSMAVEGIADEKEIIKAVEKAGYTASLKGKKVERADSELKDTETPSILKRLGFSAVLLLVLMYFSMGAMMWGFPLPSFFEGNFVAQGLLQLLLALSVMIINKRFFVSGFKAVLHKSPNMDTLVALGSGASFLWSTYNLFMMTAASGEAVHTYFHDLWFESAAMIVTLITVGKLLESRSKGKTTDALKALMRLAPKTATVEKDGKETVISVDELKKGDIFIVRPGESIPTDGIVTEGISAVDESALTGESIPADKTVGSKVSAGTINKSGYLKCEATRVGEDTTLSQIIKTVSDAAATKAPIAKVADKVSGVFVPAVLVIALITTVIWLLTGETLSFALARGISVLVISCPCALGLATPVAIMVGSGMGAKGGILFKTAASLEEAGRIETVILDKTGTITKGEPSVTDIVPFGVSEKELLEIAYSLEYKSEHPLALAVSRYAKEKGIKKEQAEDFTAFTGSGVYAEIKGKKAFSGNLKFIKDKSSVSADAEKKGTAFAEEGKTPLYFVFDGSLVGIIAVADKLKEDSKKGIEELYGMGIEVVMLTGDNEKTARAIGKEAGIENVISGVLPDEKEAVVRSFCQKGKTAMVGDGINDAPALTRADLGIAIGAGTDVAIDAADIVLVNSKLTDVSAAVRLGRQVLRNIHENLFWAFIYNASGIPLAAGVFISVFGWKLNPMFGAAAMSLSSFCVVSNALRLNLFNIHSTKRDKKIKHKNKRIKEKKPMTKTVKIEGMMCPHCEARVKKILEQLPEVTEAVTSHTEGTAVLTLNADVSDEVLKGVIEADGYKFIG